MTCGFYQVVSARNTSFVANFCKRFDQESFVGLFILRCFYFFDPEKVCSHFIKDPLPQRFFDMFFTLILRQHVDVPMEQQQMELGVQLRLGDAYIIAMIKSFKEALSKSPVFEDVCVEVDADGNTDYSLNEFVLAVCGVAILRGKTSSGSFWD
eukprot:2982294-Rhodomonas_salina.1